MLILVRKIGEGIVADGQSTFRVLDVQGDRVRIGIIAPDTTRVGREELCDGGKLEPRKTPKPTAPFSKYMTQPGESPRAA